MIDENHNLARKAAVLAGRIPTSAATKSDNYLLMEINAGPRVTHACVRS